MELGAGVFEIGTEFKRLSKQKGGAARERIVANGKADVRRVGYPLDYQRDDWTLRERTIRGLDTEIENMKIAIFSRSVETRLDADYVFHGLVFSVCENRIFQNLYQTMREFMKMELNFAQKDVDTLTEIPTHHEKLPGSIADGNFNIATERFRTQILNIDHLLGSKRKSDPLTYYI